MDISHIIIEEKNINEINNTTGFHPKKISYLGNGKTKFNLLFLIDDSPSMLGIGKNFNIVKDNIIELIKILKNYPTFDTSIGITTLISRDNITNFPLNKWYNLNNDYTEIINKIFAITLQGEGKDSNNFGTPLYYSINECFKYIEIQEKANTGINLMVVLSDGKDNDTTSNEIIKENIICPIKLIGYQWNPDNDTKITEIVKKSGAGGKGLGYFCDVKNEGLEQVFGNILQIVFKRYRITWNTYFSNDNTVQRKIKVIYGDKEKEYNI